MVSNVEGWSTFNLKQYVDQRFLDSDKAVSAALQAAKEAVAKAEVATDKRFDAITEDADRRAHELSVQIMALQTSRDHGEGSTSTTQRFWSLALPTLMSLAMLVTVLIIAYKP